MIGKYRRKFVKLKGYEMKKRMKMAAAVMAAVMGMMTLGGCGTASEKSKTAALTGIRMRSIPLFIRRSSAVIMRKKDWM